jgi:hypothetical protein
MEVSVPDPIQAYLDALQRLNNAKALVEVEGKILEGTHIAIKNKARKVPASKINPGEALAILASRGDASTGKLSWRSSEGLMALLANYNKISQRVRDAWFAVPEQDRSSLQAPPVGILVERTSWSN